MASSPPAAHTMPVWPFSWQFRLITVNGDTDFRQEVVVSPVAIGAAVALMVAALLWRRFRLLAAAILMLAVVLRGPSFSLLTAEAYPTSFQISPNDFPPPRSPAAKRCSPGIASPAMAPMETAMDRQPPACASSPRT